uniref:C-type lectin domain-containing protein n=4 Tax=Salarias fasciatus TaxID=181472 RepID=A0A672JM59_SALFA
MHRDKARDKCEEEGGKLLSLYDQEDAEFIKWILENETQDKSFWIGLKKTNKALTWSDGANFPLLNLGSEHHFNQECGAIENPDWKAFNCSEPKYFMCNNGTDNILITEEKNWCQAQWYCRKHHRDLVSINGKIPQKVLDTGGTKTFWTGFQQDSWQWDDGQCSTYRDWNSTNEQETCAVISQSGMKTYGCQSPADVLCSKGILRVELVRERKTWEEALHYCKEKYTDMLWIEDEDDQKAVEDQVEYILSRDRIDGPLWIATRQSAVFGFWIWSDRIVSYSRWVNGIMPEMPLSYKCGVINPHRNYMWSDADCSRKLPFLCEKEIHSWEK